MMMNNSFPISMHLPCPSHLCKQKKPTTDAYTLYSDGHGYCFSCNSFHPADHIESNSDMGDTYEFIPWRGVTRETMEFYNIVTKVNETGEPVEIAFPYDQSDTFKIRSIKEKKFYSKGSMNSASLFGSNCFSAGSHTSIILTEGELDAASAYQMLKIPAVSVRSSTSAKVDCQRKYEYLNSFSKIYLCFDNDEPGQKATKEVSSLFDINKVYYINLTKYKDANEYLQNSPDEFKAIFFNSKKYQPEGIISTLDEFSSIVRKQESTEGVPYPFSFLTKATYGIRPGEVVLITGLEGIGKTEVIRSIEYNVLCNTQENIGIIHLEESKKRNLQGLAGYHLKQPVHLPDCPISSEEIDAAIRNLVTSDNRLNLYSHFGSDDPRVILETIRYLASVANCKFIFLDHISMVVSGLNDDEERKTLDFLSTRLAMMVQEYNFGLVMVSHVNDDGKTRGSRNISKIANVWIHLDRDIEHHNEEIRNITKMTIRKNRFSSISGPVGSVKFNPSTFLLEEQSEIRRPF